MPHWYLASWEWETVAGPSHWRAPAGAVAAIDLRSLSAQGTPGPTAAGSGFFGFNATQTLPGAEYFGDDLTANLNLNRRNAWRNKLSIATALDNTRLVDVLAETLGQKATPGGNVRAKPVIPTSAGRIEIWAGTKVFDRDFGGTGDVCWPNIQAMHQDDYRSVRLRCLAFANAIENCTEGDGSLAARTCSLFAFRNGVTFATAKTTLAQRFRDKFKRYLGGLTRKYRRWTMARQLFIPADLTDEGELPPETTITDDFTRADGDTIGNQLTWTEVAGDWDTASNAASLTTFGTDARTARAESDLSSDDHYSQTVITGLGAGTNDCLAGPVARFDAAANTGYWTFAYQFDDKIYLRKIVTGTPTNLVAAVAITLSIPEAYKVECDGSTITGYQAGVSRIGPTTDSAIAGNTRCGIGGYKSTGSVVVDDFEAADLAAAASTSGNLLLLGVG